jgi:hypothetical protein
VTITIGWFTLASDFEKMVIAAHLEGVESYYWKLSYTDQGPDGVKDHFRLCQYTNLPMGVAEGQFQVRVWQRWAVRLKDKRLAVTAAEMAQAEGRYGQQ